MSQARAVPGRDEARGAAGAPDRRDRAAVRALDALTQFGFSALGLSPADFEEPDSMMIQLGDPPGRIDLLSSIDGVNFNACWERRMVVDVAGLRLPVLGLEGFRANKRAVGRPKVLANLASLDEPPEA